ncbi:MAG: HAMP domain-containing histidine kinase [Clostridiales bacterium]|nr:HAMP domain-containing histidine kinase [Clostridiales bacterium]
MFRKIHHKLVFICCLITSGIVLLIILICLSLSEKNMRNEEEALFLLKTNAISFDLLSSREIDRAWYGKNIQSGSDLLYIEVNGNPSTLSSLLLTDSQMSLIGKVKKKAEQIRQENGTDSSPVYTYDSSLTEKTFSYKTPDHSYLVMASGIEKNSASIDYLYLHSLDSLNQKVFRQRICYFFIWLASIGVLYVFSFYFTAHTLKPLIQNQEKQKQFIALASHELRSPLAVFKTGLSILKSGPEPAKANRFYHMLGDEIKRMERLINDLLFLSKAEQSSLNYQFAPVNLPELLNRVYQKYLPISEEKEILLTLDTKDFSELWCVCDSQRMEQVIIILLDNAFTYTPPKGLVTLGLESSRTRHSIYVRDNGCGISDADKDKIFDKFYQANASHNNKEHFGLGLSIAKEICHAHKGTISVSDAKGGGTTFTIKLNARSSASFPFSQ